MVASSTSLTFGRGGARWVLAATVLGTAVGQIDGSLTNLALPAIARDLHTTLEGLTWVVNGYTLTLASFIMLGGALGDRFGRRRVFVLGLCWFVSASMLCALAPTTEILIAARGLQGVGGALLAPASLAILQASFRVEDRGRAVAAWSGLTGVAGAAAPLVGGYLLAVGSWRWVFVVNVPLAFLVLWASRAIPETRRGPSTGGLDVPGTLLGALALGGLTLTLSFSTRSRFQDVAVLLPLVLSVVGATLFWWWEHHAVSPLLPPACFRSRLFVVTNAITGLVYAAFAGVVFWLILALQVVVGFTALQAGVGLLPITGAILVLSRAAGAWARRVGLRLPTTFGLTLCAASVASLAHVGVGASYWKDVFGPVLGLGVGSAVVIVPLTVAALDSVPVRRAGLASGFNSLVARAGGLIAVAVLPLITGLGGAASGMAGVATAFPKVMLLCAAMMVSAAAVAAVTLRGADVMRQPDTPASAARGGEAVMAVAEVTTDAASRGDTGDPQRSGGRGVTRTRAAHFWRSR